jgi:hypothetical protein
MAPKKGVNGTFLRGADGALYFLPKEVMDQWKVPKRHAPRVQRIVDGQEKLENLTTSGSDLSPLTKVQSKAHGIAEIICTVAVSNAQGGFRPTAPRAKAPSAKSKA